MSSVYYAFALQARRDVAERADMVQREQELASNKVQLEWSEEKDKLDKEVARLRQDKRRLDGLNRELNEKTNQVSFEIGDGRWERGDGRGEDYFATRALPSRGYLQPGAGKCPRRSIWGNSEPGVWCASPWFVAGCC